MKSAHAVLMLSALVRHGPYHLIRMAGDLETWMDERAHFRRARP